MIRRRKKFDPHRALVALGIVTYAVIMLVVYPANYRRERGFWWHYPLFVGGATVFFALVAFGSYFLYAWSIRILNNLFDRAHAWLTAKQQSIRP